MKIAYNKRSDVLYITITVTPNHCSYIETPGGVIARIDDATKQVVGVTIYDFLKRAESGERMSIPNIGNDLSGAALLKLYSQAS